MNNNFRPHSLLDGKTLHEAFEACSQKPNFSTLMECRLKGRSQLNGEKMGNAILN